MLNIEGDAPWLITLQGGMAELSAVLDQWLAPLEQELDAIAQGFEGAFA